MTRSTALVGRSAALVAGLAIAAAVVAYATMPSAQISPATAASLDYFIKIDGVDGESTKDGHKNEIEILSWSWGMSNSGSMASGGGGGAGKVNVQDLVIMKRIDKSSPLLMKACASGQVIKTAVLSMDSNPLRPGSGDPINDDGGSDYRVTFSDLKCTSFTQSGDQSSAPTESLSLNYTKIQVTYQPKDGSSAVKASWNLKENVK